MSTETQSLTIPAPLPDREPLRRAGQRLEWFTIAYNVFEAAFALGFGVVADSVALISFGLDSLIEVTSASALLWRLRHDRDSAAREQRALRIVGICFLVLAAYVAFESIETLVTQSRPRPSLPGMVLALLSVVIMPLLARAKRRVARSLNSAALVADSRQTDFCAYLSAILLVGLAAHQFLGSWWADPAASLGMCVIIAREGVEALRGRACGGSTCGCH